MKNQIVNFKIYLQQTTIQLRLDQKKVAELAVALRSKTSWIDLPVSKEQSLHLKSESIIGYETTTPQPGGVLHNGLMKLNALADSFDIHPVSLSRLISQGKIPAVSSEGKKRQHSQANIETALALRNWLRKQGKETLSEAEIKKLFQN